MSAFDTVGDVYMSQFACDLETYICCGVINDGNDWVYHEDSFDWKYKLIEYIILVTW